MEITIFDVSHGFCAYAVDSYNKGILIDCGHSEDTGFRPSTHLQKLHCAGIEMLIIQNYDEDHISDLSNLRKKNKIKTLLRNISLSPLDLRKLKESEARLTESMKSLIEMLNRYSKSATNPPKFSDIEIKTFYNNYPEFTDPNNLSLVTFLHCEDASIIFPGDLEKAGWEALLKKSEFCEELKKVKIFVASHHGRDNGYCKSVFTYCKPDVVIISDKEIIHKTQINKYAQHASGYYENRYERRKVYTTRSDGNITITTDSSSLTDISNIFDPYEINTCKW